MKYIEGFKYQLYEDESCHTPLRGYIIETEYYSLNVDGVLTGKRGFAWDGCSGSIDTDTNLRASLFHDIGCLMVAKGELPRECLDVFNELFHDHLGEDGMSRMRQWWHFKAVTAHFANGTSPERREVIFLDKPDKASPSSNNDEWGMGL